jgi:hypothetical protein
LYDTQIRQNAYFIYATDEIILMFNNDNNMQAVGVKNAIEGFTLFDNNNNWIGTMISDAESGFIFYSQNNQQIGFVK